MSQEIDTLEWNNFTRKDYEISKAKPEFVRRGMGATGKTGRVMLDAERMTICMLRGKGLSNDEIAEKLKRATATVAKVLREAEQSAKAMGLNYDWREEIRAKSVAALRSGLDCKDDPYKRANLGIAGLKGLGEFEADNTVNVAALVNSVPESEKSRYVTLESTVINEGEGVQS